MSPLATKMRRFTALKSTKCKGNDESITRGTMRLKADECCRRLWVFRVSERGDNVHRLRSPDSREVNCEHPPSDLEAGPHSARCNSLSKSTALKFTLRSRFGKLQGVSCFLRALSCMNVTCTV